MGYEKRYREIVIMENTALIIIDLQIGVQPENVPLYNLANVLKGVNQRIPLLRQKTILSLLFNIMIVI